MRQLSFLFQLSIQKHLMAILPPVLPTRHMYPVVEAVLRFEDQLVIVGVLLAVGHWGSQHPQLIARGNARSRQTRAPKRHLLRTNRG